MVDVNALVVDVNAFGKCWASHEVTGGIFFEKGCTTSGQYSGSWVE